MQIDPADPQRLDDVLRLLASRMEADVVELLMATPGGEEMVLVSHHGADEEAFGQRDRFRRGEGFPGIVLDTASALSTTALETEIEFVRSRVKGLGYRSALCVPIHCGDHVGGCLLLAWQTRRPSLDRPVREAVLASVPLGSALEVARVRKSSLPPGPDVLKAIEARLRETTAADDARVMVVGSPGPGLDDDACDGALGPDQACPALLSGRPQVLGGRAGWPSACISSECVCRARYCLPLKEGVEVWGVATVSYGHATPAPLTRWLPAALWLAETMSPLRFSGAGDPPSSTQPEPPRGTRLVVRCFGGFEVRVADRRLTTSDFGRTKSVELLARLVVAGGRPQCLEELAKDLWPDADPGKLRNRFHVTLSALRAAIEPGTGGSRRWLHLRSESGGYFLDPDSPMYVDLWHFDTLLRQAASARPDSRASDAGIVLDHAAHLYRGDLFHRSFTADWSKEAARQWRDRYLRVLHRVHESTAGRASWLSGYGAHG